MISNIKFGDHTAPANDVIGREDRVLALAIRERQAGNKRWQCRAPSDSHDAQNNTRFRNLSA